MIRAIPLFAVSLMSIAADYSAEKIVIDSIPVVRLKDSARSVEVSVVPSLGNNAYEMKVKGRNFFWSPYMSPAEFKAKPAQLGNPFLAPWANRLDQEAFFANGKKFVLNPELKNYRRDNFGQPIHGLVVFADWEVVRVAADAGSASVTSRLEFWRRPEWMAQFPFAHTIEMTYRLRDGMLEVETAIENQSKDTMPVSIGYHTYYQLTASPRDEWKIRVPARDSVELSPKLVPTGATKPVSLPDPVPLGGTQLDDVFANLKRDASGRAEFRAEGKGETLSVWFGPKYAVGVVYAPKGRNFICFEPMSGVTNAFNLAHAGRYPELQTIAPGAVWKESFWIRASVE